MGIRSHTIVIIPVCWFVGHTKLLYCYGTKLVLVTICCFIAAQEKRLDLHRSDLKIPLKINFAAVFEFNKIDELKNGTERQKQTEINPGIKNNLTKLKSPCDFIFQIKCVQPPEILN